MGNKKKSASSVKKCHKFDWTKDNVQDFKKANSEKSLFGLNKDALRERFKNAAERAGYLHGLLSFHSLRSGFICSALIKAYQRLLRCRGESASNVVSAETGFKVPYFGI